ncbi:MAG: HlyD family secretion protein, partial [Candidatus Rokuibacteriota bacterium]
MKRVSMFVLAALFAGAVVGGYFLARGGGGAPKYRVARVDRGRLTSVVSANGTLNSVVSVQVGSQVSGQIKELLADFNSVVRKGQVIAQIDPEIFAAKVNQARAEVDSAQATVLTQRAQVGRARADVENARAAHAEGKAQTARARVTVADTKRDLDRKTELVGRQLIAKSEYDSAQAAYDAALTQVDAARAKEQSLAAAIVSAEAQLDVAEAMLQSARAQVKQKEAALQQGLADLEHTTIRAPVDGVVVSRAVDVGQTVAASLQAPTLFTIAQDLTKMQVDTSVVEADIGRIKLGDRATFTVDAFPTAQFTGEVVQIRKAAQTVQNVVTYTVVVAVANPEGQLMPGMTANVKVVAAEKANVLKAPNAALRFRPTGVEVGMDSSPAERPAVSAGGDGAVRETTRERLVRELKLSDEQQAELDRILGDGRDQRRVIREAALPESERKVRSQKVREATRERIRDILTPDQHARYDQIAAATTTPADGVPGRVWVPGPGGRPKPIALLLGLSDGAATEVLQGDLKEGQEVITGTIG